MHGLRDCQEAAREAVSAIQAQGGSSGLPWTRSANSPAKNTHYPAHLDTHCSAIAGGHRAGGDCVAAAGSADMTQFMLDLASVAVIVGVCIAMAWHPVTGIKQE